MAAADEHGGANGLGVLGHALEKAGHGHVFAGDIEPVVHLNDEGTIGNDGFTMALHRHELHMGKPGVQPAEGFAGDVVLVRHQKFHHFHPAVGEGFDVHGKGEAQQPGDFLSGGAFRVDDLIDIQLFLQKGQAFGVFRVANAGDGIAGTQLFGGQAADHVQFVVGGDGDDDVRLFRPGLNEGAHVAAVAPHAQYIQGFGGPGQGVFVLINNGHVVVLAGKIFR